VDGGAGEGRHGPVPSPHRRQLDLQMGRAFFSERNLVRFGRARLNAYYEFSSPESGEVCFVPGKLDDAVLAFCGIAVGHDDDSIGNVEYVFHE